MTTRSKDWIVAVSDIHIGDGGPTCWYQPSLHERPLVAMLEWVIDNHDRVRELVLLGDVVDLWTYPFSQRPPSFADIAAANPSIFGPTGALCRAMDALDGAVVWVPGNHDMGISPAEAAGVVSEGGHALRLSSGLTHFPLGADRRVLMSHGHAHTLFNATDPTSPWSGMPVGHMITRSVAEHWHRNLEPGTTVADLPGQGAPNGLDLSGLVGALSGAPGDGIVGVLFDYLGATLDIDEGRPIQMFDGTATDIASARSVYADLWQRWARTHEAGRPDDRVGQGVIEAARSAWADGMELLGWHAQAEAFSHGADLVVMGHTHTAVDGLTNSFVGYLNSGFECPSRLDADERPITFSVVEVADDGLDAQVWEVAPIGDMFVCRPTTAAAESVTNRLTMDFSTYVEVDNRGGATDLELVDAVARSGRLINEAPPVIPAGTIARFWVQDDLGPYGSELSLSYRSEAAFVALDAACPTGVRPNRCRTNQVFTARSSDDDWRAPGSVPAFGHPLFIRVIPTETAASV